MKKGLLLLPLVGGMMLAGCDLSNLFNLFKKDNNQQQNQGNNNQGNNNQGNNNQGNNDQGNTTGGDDHGTGGGNTTGGDDHGTGGGTITEGSTFVMDFTDGSWKDDKITPYVSNTEMGAHLTFVYQSMTFNDVGCYASAGYNGAPNYLMMKNTKYGENKDTYATDPAFFGNQTPFAKPIKKVEVVVEGSSSSGNTVYRVNIGTTEYGAAVTTGGAEGKKGQTFSVTSTDSNAFYFAVSTNKTADGKIYNGQLTKVTITF